MWRSAAARAFAGHHGALPERCNRARTLGSGAALLAPAPAAARRPRRRCHRADIFLRARLPNWRCPVCLLACCRRLRRPARAARPASGESRPLRPEDSRGMLSRLVRRYSHLRRPPLHARLLAIPSPPIPSTLPPLCIFCPVQRRCLGHRGGAVRRCLPRQGCPGQQRPSGGCECGAGRQQECSVMPPIVQWEACQAEQFVRQQGLTLRSSASAPAKPWPCHSAQPGQQCGSHPGCGAFWMACCSTAGLQLWLIGRRCSCTCGRWLHCDADACSRQHIGPSLPTQQLVL